MPPWLSLSSPLRNPSCSSVLNICPKGAIVLAKLAKVCEKHIKNLLDVLYHILNESQVFKKAPDAIMKTFNSILQISTEYQESIPKCLHSKSTSTMQYILKGFSRFQEDCFFTAGIHLTFQPPQSCKVVGSQGLSTCLEHT